MLSKSFYLEDMVKAQKQHGARHFIIPTQAEIDHLSIGSQVRLFFVLNFEVPEGCRAERMWVEIFEINQNSFQGYITNQPVYIKDLNIGDVVVFSRENIATIIIPRSFDEQKKALISKRAIEKREVNWLYRTSPYNPEDSGWKLFYGDEDEEYNSHVSNVMIATLEQIMSIEPRLESVFASEYNAFEWNEAKMQFTVVD